MDLRYSDADEAFRLAAIIATSLGIAGEGEAVATSIASALGITCS